jgi:hypothetical protein
LGSLWSVRGVYQRSTVFFSFARQRVADSLTLSSGRRNSRVKMIWSWNLKNIDAECKTKPSQSNQVNVV